ncbi:hypothetical protein BDP27DRAFT_1431143 [Rhodocollybia butyracea]|uniref:Uncharacterized protein n=1 Tax=Rhodocollybia butyracea TaxID=206335 RepID=A0A9P5TY99_9AGAR|nr:hypothetical protein BDP27DRAFT_1431143 [Rhodocollybia butyracea]
MSWSNEVTVIIDNAPPNNAILPGGFTVSPSPLIPFGMQASGFITTFENSSSILGVLSMYLGDTQAHAPWYNGSVAYANQYVHSTIFGSTVQITYIGAAAALFGFTPGNDTIFQAQLLGQTAQLPAGIKTLNVSFPLPATYCQFYTSPDQPLPVQLNAEYNEIVLDLPIGFAWDYALLKVTNSSDLSGQKILVDDVNDEIEWKGNWKLESDTFLDMDNMAAVLGHGLRNDSYSLLHASHFVFQNQTTITLESQTLYPTGTSISVYGVNTQFPGAGILTMTFTLDNKSTSAPFTYEPSSNFVPGFSNFQYFSQDNLVPGNHTLIVEVTQIQGGNISAVIDYLTYTPSWMFLIDKPNFFGLNSTTPNPNSAMGAAGSNNSGLTSKEKTGIIAGSVIGGIVALGMICFFFVRFLKNKKSQPQLEDDLIYSPFPIDIDKITLHESAELDRNMLDGPIGVHAGPTPLNTSPEVVQSVQDVLNMMLITTTTPALKMRPPSTDTPQPPPPLWKHYLQSDTTFPCFASLASLATLARTTTDTSTHSPLL